MLSRADETIVFHSFDIARELWEKVISNTFTKQNLICRGSSIWHIWQLRSFDNQPMTNYFVKDMVFALLCSSKSAGLKKVYGEIVCFVYAKQQIPALTAFSDWRGRRQLHFLPNCEKPWIWNMWQSYSVRCFTKNDAHGIFFWPWIVTNIGYLSERQSWNLWGEGYQLTEAANTSNTKRLQTTSSMT